MLPHHILNILRAEEEESLEEMKKFNRERRLMRDESDPFNLNDMYFKQYFRINKDMAHYILNRILHLLHTTDNVVAIPPHIKFFAALSFFASGSYQRGIGQNFVISISQQCASRAINEVSLAIVDILGQEHVQFPVDNNQRNNIKHRFMERSGFPGVIGAIDATHVSILAPSREEHNYINRKGYHSKNVQIICSYDMKILNINAQFPGSTHDSFIWRNSNIHRLLERAYIQGERNNWLVGDSGYPLQPWLMTPVRNPQLNGERLYNEAHIRARNCVERCIGILKCRFRCISGERVLRYNPDKVGTIVNTCAILHNICIDGRLEEVEDLALGEEVADIVVNEENEFGNDIRRLIIDQYF